MYEKYVELRDKKGVTDYRVAMDTGIPKSTFGKTEGASLKQRSLKLSLIISMFLSNTSLNKVTQDMSHKTDWKG